MSATTGAPTNYGGGITNWGNTGGGGPGQTSNGSAVPGAPPVNEQTNPNGPTNLDPAGTGNPILNPGPTFDPGTAQPPSGPNGASGNPWNLDQYQGPYSAPLTSGQQNALSNFNNNTIQNPIVQSQDITNSIYQALQGGPVFGPNAGKSLTEATQNFQLPSVARGVAEGQATNPNRFDNTELFRNQEQVFNSDLDRRMAQIKEEYSGLGLGPGASDRSGELARTAGNSLANFRVGQQGIASSSFENAENRRMGALPILSQLEEQPFNRYMQVGTAAQQGQANALPALFDAANLPLQHAQGQYNINEQARGAADIDAQRRMAENARTQGGALQQLLAIISGTPENNVAMGPSDLSQFAQLLSGIGSLIPGIGR